MLMMDAGVQSLYSYSTPTQEFKWNATDLQQGCNFSGRVALFAFDAHNWGT